MAEKEICDDIMVCIADVNNEMTKKLAMLTGVEDFTQVSVRIMDPNPGKTSVKKYFYNQDRIAAKEIVNFVKDFLSNKIRPSQKSESDPNNRAPNLVLPLSSDSFEKVTMDKDLDVMVLFYTTNSCKLCEELWPIYTQLATLLIDTVDLRFTSINMAHNELEEVHNIFYYPMLRYYPRDSKHRPYDYDLGLSLEEMITFVKRVASVQPILKEDKGKEDVANSKDEL